MDAHKDNPGCNDLYDTYRELRQKEKESKERLTKLREDIIINYPNNTDAEETIKQIDEALSKETPDSPECVGAGASSSHRSGVCHDMDISNGLASGATVHIEGLTTLSGVDINFPIEPFKLPGQEHDNNDGGDSISRCATLQDHVEIWKTNERRKIALYTLARDGQFEAVKQRIQDGDINNCGCVVETVQQLLKKGDDLNFTDENGRNLLHWVALHGHVEEITPLIGKGIDVNAPDVNGQTALFLALDKGHVEVVRALLEAGANCRMSDISQKSPLHVAGQNGNVNNVRHLITAGSDLTVVDMNGLTPIHVVIKEGNLDLIRYLLGSVDGETTSEPAMATASVAMDTGTHPTRISDRNIRAEILQARDIIGVTYLHYAIVKEQPEIVHALLDAGIDPNFASHEKIHALHLAVCREATQTVSKLISKGADVNVRDKYGKTALHFATKMNNQALVATLIDKGADINCTDQFYRTPLLYACQTGIGSSTKALVKFLLEKNADATSSDCDGRTPLHYASMMSSKPIVEDIVNAHGVDINTRDNDGSTALSLACAELQRMDSRQVKRRYNEIITYLQKHGAHK